MCFSLVLQLGKVNRKLLYVVGACVSHLLPAFCSSDHCYLPLYRQAPTTRLLLPSSPVFIVLININSCDIFGLLVIRIIITNT